MSGAFIRDALPGWHRYADDHGLTLQGRGKWLSVLCDFHADTEPSMRVNTETGGWICMSCGAKGGDVLSHYMQRIGADFVQAAKDLGAWNEAAVPRAAGKPRTLSAADAMQVVRHELLVLFVVIADVRAGVIPNDADWHRFTQGAGRIDALAQEYAA